MTSRSKTQFQGQQLRRVHRSELEDNTMRDQARHSLKLEENLKTVDRAKNVMIKSMEADKQMFIKTGQTKTKVSKPQSTQPAAGRQSQQTRLVPDSRVKKTSQLNDSTHDTTSSATKPVANGTLGATNDTTKEENKPPKSPSVGPDIQIPELDSNSIYDKFLADNTAPSPQRKKGASGTTSINKTHSPKPKQ